jgi:hypothetical protein
VWQIFSSLLDKPASQNDRTPQLRVVSDNNFLPFPNRPYFKDNHEIILMVEI